jgi:hypothetical protein
VYYKGNNNQGGNTMSGLTQSDLAELLARPTTGTLVELAIRESCDEKVQLFWQPVTGQTFIRITPAQGEIITRRVPNDEARHAFDHPYVYCD